MRIRTLVPALACLAAAPAFIAAADPAPTPVKIDGFVDTIYSWTDSKTDGVSNGPASGFEYFAKLGAEITITDKVAGQIDITSANNSYTDTNNGVYIRQAYGTWKVTPEATFKSGRFIDCIGWSSPYAPGLWRVNAGPVPGLYGVDSPVGIDATYSKDVWTFEASIVNGFFGEGHGEASQSDPNNHNGYAYIVDAAYTLPNKKGTLDVEAVWETDAAANVVATPTQGGGNGYHLGANATLTPNDQVKVGLEAIYQKIKAPNNSGLADEKNLGLLAQVNYTIPKAPWGANVTGSVEYLKETNGAVIGGTNFNMVDGASTKVTEVAVALLTNPANTSNFGVNAEIGYTKANLDDGTGVTSTKGWALTLEALYMIP